MHALTGISWTRRSRSCTAEMTTIGTSGHRSSAWHASRNENPSITGIIRSRTTAAGRVVTLRVKHIPQPDGSTRMREIVEHAPGAAVVAVDRDGQVLLVRQPRPAVGAHVLELPAGLVDPGEQPIDTARRELEEETG